MRIKHLSLLLVVSLVAAACSSDSVLGQGTDSTILANGSYVDTATEMVDRWGDRDAFLVTLWALDSGYRTSQIIEAGAAAIDADGTIRAADGSGVTPLDPAPGKLSLQGPSAAGIWVELASLAEQTPADAYVSDIGLWAGEIFDAGEAHVTEQQQQEQEAAAQREAEISFTWIVLSLSARGYTIDQISESMYLGEFTSRPADLAAISSGIGQLCSYLERDGKIIAPGGRADSGYEERCQPLIPESESTVSTTTTTAAVALPPPVPGPDTIDGTYIGTVELGIQPINFEMLDGSVVAVIGDGQAQTTVAVTLQFAYRYIDDAIVCTATVAYVWSATAPAAETMAPTMIPETVEVLATEGPECGINDNWAVTAKRGIQQEWREEEPWVIDITVDEGVLTATTFDGVFVMTARR